MFLLDLFDFLVDFLVVGLDGLTVFFDPLVDLGGSFFARAGEYKAGKPAINVTPPINEAPFLMILRRLRLRIISSTAFASGQKLPNACLNTLTRRYFERAIVSRTRRIYGDRQGYLWVGTLNPRGYIKEYYNQLVTGRVAFMRGNEC